MSSAAPEVATASKAGASTGIGSRTVRALGWVLAASLLALVTWQVPGIMPQPSLDDSWRIALHMAASQGLDFGRDIVFTYGPLGFLSAPMLVGTATAASSFAYAAVVQVALALVVLRAASRTFGWPLGVVLAYLALGLPLLVSDFPVYIAFFGCVWVLERTDAPRWWWLSAVGGALAAFELLVKLNGGVTCLLLFALAAWRLPPGRLRSEGILVASLVGSLVLLWLLTGNPLSALPEWLQQSQQVVSGYTDAMALDTRTRLLEYVTAALLLVGAAALFAFRLRSQRARFVPLLLAAALYCFAYLKEGFVRHDGHDAFFFSAFALGVLAFYWQGRARWGAVALILGAVAAIVLSPENTLFRLYQPTKVVNAAITNALDVAESGRRSRLIEEWKAAAGVRLGVSPASLGLLKGHTVDVVPVQTSAIWAYDLRWKPEPLLQWYMAYNADLDDFNAKALAAHGAQRVLRARLGVVDGKEPMYEAPATYLALLCHYREIASDSSWEVLARVRDRCRQPRRLGEVRARAGETVAVPSVHAPAIVYARIRFPEPVLGRLESALFKPVRLPRLTLGGGPEVRFIPATATGPLVLQVPTSAGRSPLFEGGVSHRTLRLRRVPSPFTIEFYAVPIEGAAWTAPPPSQPGRLEQSTVVFGDHRYPIVPGAVSGFVEEARSPSGAGAIVGWAADGAEPAERVLVFAGGTLLADVGLTQARPDVAKAMNASPGVAGFGYAAAFDPPEAEPVRVFALAGGRASELVYPPNYPWPH